MVTVMSKSNERDERSAAKVHVLPQTDEEWFAYLAAQTRAMWETHGFCVHVSTNDGRVVVTRAES